MSFRHTVSNPFKECANVVQILHCVQYEGDVHPIYSNISYNHMTTTRSGSALFKEYSCIFSTNRPAIWLPNDKKTLHPTHHSLLFTPRCIKIYTIGKIPTVLISAIQMNHARWLLRAAFHIAIIFQVASHKIAIIRNVIKVGFVKNEWYIMWRF